MGDSTRLSDLPSMQENVHYQMPANMFPQASTPPQPPPSFQNQGNISLANSVSRSAGISQSNYMPINVHPNPYGNNPNANPLGELPPWDDLPEQGRRQGQVNSQMGGQTTSLDDLPDFVPTTPQKLPSRDIPMNTIQYSQDEEIQANYVPPTTPNSTKRVKDYIKEYDETESTRIRNHETAKFRTYWMEETLRSYQIPLLIAILFFIFNMNVVSRVMFLYLGKFKAFYQEDGALNTYGILFKSILFAGIYWVLQYILYSI